MVAVGDETGQEVDEEIRGAAVTGMLNLADILEFIVDALDQGALAQEQFIGGPQDLCAHVLVPFGDEDEALLDQEVLGERLRDVAPVTEEFAEQATDQARDRAAIIDMAGRQAEGEQRAPLVIGSLITRCSLNP